MKSLLTLALAFGFSVQAESATFSYNSARGKCMDAQGNVGLNKIEETNLLLPADIVEQDEFGNYVSIVFKNRSAECTDLSNVDINSLIRKPEYGWGYLTLENWNLNGAVMRGARISFSHGNFSVKGADLTGFQGGYLTGPVVYDRFTVGLQNCLKTKTPRLCEWRM